MLRCWPCVTTVGMVGPLAMSTRVQVFRRCQTEQAALPAKPERTFLRWARPCRRDERGGGPRASGRAHPAALPKARCRSDGQRSRDQGDAR
eukprot:7240423-Prymnesium_polylepis.1